MRTTGYNTASRARFDVQMTPMIDVVFQLLIFFVCTVSFQVVEQSLPATPRVTAEAGGAAAEQPVPPELEDLRQVEVKLARTDGRTTWSVNGDACATFADVGRRLTALARLKQFKTIVPVVLDVADDVPLADAIEVYDTALGLGFEKVQFVTEE
jgi:biopolymer transport protein ExbD